MKVYKTGLEGEKAKDAIRLTKALKDLPLDRDKFFDLITDWESRRTIAAKRFLSTFTTVLAIGWLLGVDYKDINLLWITSLDHDQAFALSVAFGVLVTFFFVTFSVSWKVDFDIRAARLDVLTKQLSSAEEIVDELHFLIPKERFPNVLIEYPKKLPSRGPFRFLDEGGPNYAAVKLYRERISKVGKVRSMLVYGELFLIFAVTALAYGGLISFWWSPEIR